MAIDSDRDIAAQGLQAVLIEHRPALLRFLAARRAAPDEAEDILQDLFVKLGAAGTGPIGEPRAYLYRMAANLLLDQRRAAGRRGAREQAWVEARQVADPAIDDRPSAEDALIARERLALVAGALAALPERTATIFQRYRIDGVAQRDIAAEQGISLSAVEKHIQIAYRAVVDARARLADADSPPPRRR
jgi:RNA polymerase sigma-70 factor (ECF subfamily)